MGVEMTTEKNGKLKR